MRSARRLLVRCVWGIAVREFARAEFVSAETRIAVIVLAGVVVAPFVVVLGGGSYLWWLITGRRLPGRLGRWLGPPAETFASQSGPKVASLPPDIREALSRRER